MADVTFALKGTADVQAKIAAALLVMIDKAEDALYKEAEIEMAESKERVPVDTGTLQNSGFVNPPDRSADGLSVTMGYGGSASAYAIAVHEDLEALHPVGEAKFLESVLRESAPYLLQRIAARIKL